MRRKPKRHDHLKKLYREELATADGTTPATPATVATAGVITAAEQRWLRRDLFRTVMVVLVLLVIIALIAVYQENAAIVGFTAKVAHWGGF